MPTDPNDPMSVRSEQMTMPGTLTNTTDSLLKQEECELSRFSDAGLPLLTLVQAHSTLSPAYGCVRKACVAGAGTKTPLPGMKTPPQR